MKKMIIKKHKKIIRGTSLRPRLAVYRSLRNIYAQLIDDDKMETLVAATDREIKALAKEKKIEKAQLVGELLAKKARAKKIKKVVFDRGGYLYHGRVKSLAQGARKGGLEF